MEKRGELERPTCVRSFLLKTYSADSPLEVTVDVGKCSNSRTPVPAGGLGCVPTKFESVVFENPNALELFQTVELCEVTENRYRLPHMEYYYVITINSSSEKEESLKVLEVLITQQLQFAQCLAFVHCIGSRSD
ncbi:uncharacterized protein pnhd [Chiloscyllium punctatum]|uniref:uncharacterized protein pnhd n=1 Tax=Chiloscyllium punctatum TaxID=137246 RepID=UPI003B640746